VWGNNREYEDKAELKFNSSAYRFEYKENEEYSRWRKGDDYIIYRNRVNNETFDVSSLLGKDYVIQDSLVCQHWKIKNDMKEVAGRICMNATWYDSIKEKEVMAWFALDLPIPIGPNKYCGLPGMILEVNEANGAVVYTATEILLSDEKNEIEKPAVKKKRKNINQEEFDKKTLDYINQCKKTQQPYFWGGVSF
jgi:GLPGLI family protein